MAERITVRTWATPLTIGAFILMAVTGMLMFFEQDRGIVTVIHQWFSWLLLLGAGGHIVANFRPLKQHLRGRWGQVSVASFASFLVASFFSWGLITGPQLERPIETALVDAPLSALAGVTHIEPDALTRKLDAHGVHATSEQSVRQLAQQSGVGENQLLAIVFLPD
jgi:hypothetical protein